MATLTEKLVSFQQEDLTPFSIRHLIKTTCSLLISKRREPSILHLQRRLEGFFLRKCFFSQMKRNALKLQKRSQQQYQSLTFMRPCLKTSREITMMKLRCQILIFTTSMMFLWLNISQRLRLCTNKLNFISQRSKPNLSQECLRSSLKMKFKIN